MRSKVLLEYKENIGIINDYLIYFVFVSEQFEIELKGVNEKRKNYLKIDSEILKSFKKQLTSEQYDQLRKIKDVLSQKNELKDLLNPIDSNLLGKITDISSKYKAYSTDFFSENTFSKGFKKELIELPIWSKNTRIFVFDSIFTFMYLTVESYFRGIYYFMNEVNKEFNRESDPISYFSHLIHTQDDDQNMQKRLDSFTNELKKLGKILIVKDDPKSSSKKPEQALSTETEVEQPIDFKELNTNETIMLVLENFKIISYDKEKKKYIVRDGLRYLKQKDIDTLEYFRLRRNTVVHRNPKDRFKGSIEDFVKKEGESLNSYWQASDPMRKFDVLSLNFTNSNLNFTDLMELVNFLNILRHILILVDQEILQILNEKEWAKFIYWNFKNERKSIGRPVDTTNFGRFYSKYNASAKKILNLKVDQSTVKAIIK